MTTIKLNVGGTRFETTYETLLNFPDSTLARMFAPENAVMLKPDTEGYHFLDRDSVIFRYVLGMYRQSKLEMPRSELDGWESEIGFYCLGDIEYKEEAIKPPRTSTLSNLTIFILKTRVTGRVGADRQYISFNVIKSEGKFLLEPVKLYMDSSIENESLYHYGDTFSRTVSSVSEVVDSINFLQPFILVGSVDFAYGDRPPFHAEFEREHNFIEFKKCIIDCLNVM